MGPSTPHWLAWMRPIEDVSRRLFGDLLVESPLLSKRRRLELVSLLERTLQKPHFMFHPGLKGPGGVYVVGGALL